MHKAFDLLLQFPLGGPLPKTAATAPQSWCRPWSPAKGLINPLPKMLRGLIRRHNHVSRDAAGIQLRAAAHIGPVEHDGHGFVGTDINLLI